MTSAQSRSPSKPSKRQTLLPRPASFGAVSSTVTSTSAPGAAAGSATRAPSAAMLPPTQTALSPAGHAASPAFLTVHVLVSAAPVATLVPSARVLSATKATFIPGTASAGAATGAAAAAASASASAATRCVQSLKPLSTLPAPSSKRQTLLAWPTSGTTTSTVTSTSAPDAAVGSVTRCSLVVMLTLFTFTSAAPSGHAAAPALSSVHVLVSAAPAATS